MAVTTAAKSVRVSMKLNNGKSSTGAIKTVSLSLGSMSKTAFDAEKTMNIINLLTPCLSKALVSVEKTAVDTLNDAA